MPLHSATSPTIVSGGLRAFRPFVLGPAPRQDQAQALGEETRLAVAVAATAVTAVAVAAMSVSSAHPRTVTNWPRIRSL